MYSPICQNITMACFMKKKWLYFSFSIYLILAIIVTFTFSIGNPSYFFNASPSNENSDLRSYTINWTARETVAITRARNNSPSPLRNGMIRGLTPPGINRLVLCFAETPLKAAESNYIPIKKDTIILQLRI